MSERWYRNEVDRMRRELSRLFNSMSESQRTVNEALRVGMDREVLHLRARIDHKKSTQIRIDRLKA